MAAYRWVDDLVTCRLPDSACTSASAPGPTLWVTSMGKLYYLFTVDVQKAIRKSDEGGWHRGSGTFRTLVP